MKLFSAIATILVSASMITAGTAGAQTKEQKAGAREAANAAGDAFDAGKFAEAADLFERAERLMHAPPHLLYAARAHVKLGHFVEARELYLSLTREQLPAAAPRVFRDAQQMGEKELADVEPRVAYMSVVVQGAAASSVRVTRNNEPVPPELLGIPTPINPGAYSYQAFADGMESTATSVKLVEGARETVVLTLRAIPGAAKTAPPAGPAPGAGASLRDGPASDAAAASGESRPLLIGAIVGFGVAAVGGGLGAYFIVKSGQTKDDANSKFGECNPGCSLAQHDQIQSLDSDSTGQKGIAIGSFVAGGVGLATGITLLMLDHGRSRAQGRGSLTPLIGLNYAGLSGRF